MRLAWGKISEKKLSLLSLSQGTTPTLASTLQCSSDTAVSHPQPGTPGMSRLQHCSSSSIFIKYLCCVFCVECGGQGYIMVQHGLAIVSLCDAVWPHNPDIGSQIWDLLPATALCVGWREGRGVQSSAKWVRSCSGAGLGSGD